jgi:hypothetical protein
MHVLTSKMQQSLVISRNSSSGTMPKGFSTLAPTGWQSACHNNAWAGCYLLGASGGSTWWVQL